MEFEWDDNKNQLNLDKHDIDFNEAVSIWQRPDALFVEYDNRGYDEDRYLAWGLLPNGVLLIVVYTYRSERIRIISARHAEPNERKRYYEKIHRAKR